MIHRSLVFFLLFLCACSGKDSAGKEEQLGRPAPAFALKDIHGNAFSLDSLSGRVVLLRFWATRCESCKVEMPKLESSFKKLAPSGVTVIAVNVEDPLEKAAPFVKELGLTYPILIDEKQRVTNLYQVYGVPTTFIIDRKGIIRERIFGDLNEKSVENLVIPLL